MKSMIENEERRKDDKGFNEKGGIMKKDKYLKVILTIIAICLVWICVKGIKIGGCSLFASNNSSGQQEVYVTGGELDVNLNRLSPTALMLCEPIEVEVTNLAYSPQLGEK